MDCPGCRYPDTRVVSTDPDDRKNIISRRRECLKCGGRFTTHEGYRQSERQSNFKTPQPNRILPK